MSAPVQFTTQCGVAITNNYDTCGTLTRANLGTLTPEQIKALFTDGTKWYELKSYLKTQFEMAACGVRRNGFYDWIMSSNRPGMSKLISTVQRDRGPSLIQPFIMARQKSIVNTDYWYITNGWDTGTDNNSALTTYVASSTGPITSFSASGTQDASGSTTYNTQNDRIIRVKSVYGGSGFELSAAWFLERTNIYILNTYSGAAAHGQWRVIKATAATDKTYVDVLIRNMNAYDATYADPDPTSGVVLIGINNVNDYESWCNNPANLNPWKHVPFWYQTRRRTRCVDTTYREMFAKLLADNEWFAEFGDLPLSERNRQDEEEWQKQFIHSFLFGRAINSYQTLTGWSSLSTISTPAGSVLDPGLSGQLIAYRANMIGVYEILKECADSNGFSRVRDLQNQALNVDELMDELVTMGRARESQGKANPFEFDIYCSVAITGLAELGLINWYKNRYGDVIRLNITPGSNDFGFSWMSFSIPRLYNMKLNFISHKTFDDLEGAQTTAGVTRGGYMLILDLGKGGSIYPAILGSNRKVYTVGDINKLAQLDTTYSCVMEAPTAEKTLTSETVTAVVECPSNSLWIEGISLSAAFIYTGKYPAYGNLYGGSNS